MPRGVTFTDPMGNVHVAPGLRAGLFFVCSVVGFRGRVGRAYFFSVAELFFVPLIFIELIFLELKLKSNFVGYYFFSPLVY